MQKGARILYLDVLRGIACLSVIMIHTSSHYVSENIGSINFWAGNIFDGLARVGVPLFVMISGALMLDKDYQFSTKKLTEHIIKMLVFFVFWSAIYSIVFYIIKPLTEHNPINIFYTLGSFIKGYYHLWYVYLIVGLYLIIPLLRLWVNDDNKKYVEYFLILSVIFTFFIPQIIETGCNYSKIFDQLNNIIETKLQLRYVGGFTAYLILGWYLNNFEIKHKKALYILGAAGLTASVAGTYILSKTTGESLQMYDNLSINILLQSVSLFVFVKEKVNNKRTQNSRIIQSVSRYSLGIYAVHVLFVTVFNELFKKIGLDFAPVNIIIVFVASFAFSFGCSFLLSKVPFLKKIV